MSKKFKRSKRSTGVQASLDGWILEKVTSLERGSHKIFQAERDENF